MECLGGLRLLGSTLQGLTQEPGASRPKTGQRGCSGPPPERNTRSERQRKFLRIHLLKSSQPPRADLYFRVPLKHQIRKDAPDHARELETVPATWAGHDHFGAIGKQAEAEVV